MNFLRRASAFVDVFLQTEKGLRFRGHVLPLQDGPGTTSTFLEPRHLLHTRPDEPIFVRDIITDGTSHPFLVADHGARRGLQKVFRLFPMTERWSWTRTVTDVEPITGLERSSHEEELGPIWVMPELYGRMEVDRGLHIGVDRTRIVTGSDVRLNDKVDGRLVRRLSTVYGVTVAEIQ